ncbi:methylation-associated defense system protein MAD7 [Actinomadura verrucosospora]|uniref:Cytoplasmic protein in type I restriction-modifcation system locus n=1 Tax=Actinomadura verrucosospora TaxID=46165 RepID=A0A7D3W402_ACTVE|nr:hypothetical protein [Actinomadura verrucosospora]QKG25571.1 cytoplasmic protein in type I restriction-modifcation system locus [Actinomadura verrucosospora]
MTLSRADREFRYPGVTFIDYKQLDMDRVLTGLLQRLRWGGSSGILLRTRDVTVDDFVATMTEHPELFGGFEESVTRRWVETHLVDMVNRGKATQAVAGLRPLHGYTYHFRNSRRSRSYGADEQIYSMIEHAPARYANTLPLLREFFFAGVDTNTDESRPGAQIDVETQALINLSKAAEGEITDRKSQAERRNDPPLYPEAAELLANDTVRLLFHKNLIPRSVLVDYLKILFAFHLGLYHLQVMKVLPARLAGKRARPDGGFFLDVGGVPETTAAALAERSAATWYGRISGYVPATFTMKRLEDFARYLVKRRKRTPPPTGFFTVDDLLLLNGSAWKDDRATFAESKLANVLEDSRGDSELPPEIVQLQELDDDPFTTYVNVITAYRMAFHRKYIRECLDSLLLKNRPGAMLAQPRRGERRFVLDGRLLEVLLQIALLKPGGRQGFHTEKLRVDEFLTILRDRYGLYIDRLPAGDGFDRPSIIEQRALRDNTRAFTTRLREIGFYSDLSDAYLTQTITPRYVIEP